VFANGKIIFCILDFINMENINDSKGVEKLFLMIKIGPRSMGSLVYSLVWCSGHKTNHNQYNIDETSACM
jgi:hypothetical protein